MLLSVDVSVRVFIASPVQMEWLREMYSYA